MKKNNYLHGFNLYNRSAAKQSQTHLRSEKEKDKKVIELHFIHPHILFLDLKKSEESRIQTASTAFQRCELKQKNTENRIKTCPVGTRSTFPMKKEETG